MRLPLKYPNVLLIDKSVTDCIINQHIIHVSGIADKVTYFTSGEAGLSYLQDSDSELLGSYVPDLIFLNHELSVMDGFQFLDRFEELPATIKERTKVVMYASVIGLQLLEDAIRHPRIKRLINRPISYEQLKSLNV